MSDAQEHPAGVTLQPGTVPQLLLAQAVQEPEILSLHLRVGLEEPNISQYNLKFVSALAQNAT